MLLQIGLERQKIPSDLNYSRILFLALEDEAKVSTVHLFHLYTPPWNCPDFIFTYFFSLELLICSHTHKKKRSFTPVRREASSVQDSKFFSVPYL